MVALALILLVFGIVMWVISGIFFYFGRETARKSALMREVRTSRAAEVSEAAPGTAVEVAGILRCDGPLKSEMAGRTCAYYLDQVIREYEVTERDEDGELQARRRSGVVDSKERFAPFSVEDGSGAVGVRGEGAEVDALEVANHFSSDPGMVFGDASDGLTIDPEVGERTLGYRHTEGILPVDAPVYVLGVVQEDGRIGAPPGGEKGRFLISHRSEERLQSSLGDEARWMGWAALGLFLAGAVFVGATVAILLL